MGCLAMGAGGLSVALAMAGEPYSIPMPKVVKVWLTGRLTGWAQAKDVILHMLSRLSVKGGVGRIFEYCGPGVSTLSVPERATITNMGAELGATGSLFPSDERTREFLRQMGREQDWEPLYADEGSQYDEEMEVDLSSIVPLAARPHMPDNVVPVAELAGLHVDQVAMGSCTNSSYADLHLVAETLRGRRVCPETDTCMAPGSRQVLAMLTEEGSLASLLESGVRLLECACGPCIGMGSSPVSGGVSVRTFNRNFEGRSGTRDAQVYLVSPVTAAQCAIHGCFTDPATWGEAPEHPDFPARVPDGRHHFLFPAVTEEERAKVEILRGPNIVALETFDALPAELSGEVTLKVGDGITTDHIMPAGAEITALRSNVPAISRYVFSRTDEGFVARQDGVKAAGRAGVIVAGGKLRTGLQPRTCGAGSASSRRARRAGQVLCPHSSRQSHQLRHPSAHFRGWCRLRPHGARQRRHARHFFHDRRRRSRAQGGRRGRRARPQRPFRQGMGRAQGWRPAQRRARPPRRITGIISGRPRLRNINTTISKESSCWTASEPMPSRGA